MSSRSDFESGLNCCAVAIEVQAVKIEALLRLEALLHHRAAIAARLLIRSLRRTGAFAMISRAALLTSPTVRKLGVPPNLIIVLPSELAIDALR